MCKLSKGYNDLLKTEKQVTSIQQKQYENKALFKRGYSQITMIIEITQDKNQEKDTTLGLLILNKC